MKIHAVTIDTANPQKLAAWWSQASGLAIGNDYGQIVQLTPSPDLPLIQFQKIEDVPTQRNRVHLDLRIPDLDHRIQYLLSIGSTLVKQYELPQIRYATLLDPDGNTFDLVAE
ncbi:hypothetical protein GLI01_31810 [Gluconacetobacter liquefaciens]|uniref:VOC family protein n=1 Tax=Gluconacetobacter liquefaciens TaxID=89584 RepID=A0A370FXQ1_GLULI|nr:VOC family protein [Gluconacetobacter liquefaciens]MBB2187935.1 VOC family protein [Gluconacetobacter liquefaciens]RDI36228.1 hypothetical protein C7453_11112 [Gluconacetobacter liquefaciens]GBR05321.1 glyoxalase [Gluconacetobacter liquefaciens NRIC 0522]GEB39146.1 hypothetical protein GLI01_31810 [Gluconacetobacter liquefaciens]